MFDVFSLIYGYYNLYSSCLKDTQGEKRRPSCRKVGRNNILKLQQTLFLRHNKATPQGRELLSWFYFKSTQGHKTIRASFWFFKQVCSYKFQNLHHWICKPEILNTKSETDTTNALFCKCEVSKQFSVVQVYLPLKFTVRDENQCVSELWFS